MISFIATILPRGRKERQYFVGWAAIRLGYGAELQEQEMNVMAECDPQFPAELPSGPRLCSRPPQRHCDATWRNISWLATRELKR
jgi:hypothetical protein